MSIYLHDIPLTQAQQIIRETLIHLGLGDILNKELIPLDEKALGRITSEPIFARLSAPHYHASAMDGFAIKSINTSEATLTRPVDLLIGEDARYLDTGDAVPQWADAVIPIEETEPLDGDKNVSRELRQPMYIRIRQSISPWRHVRPLGEDMVATQLVLPAGHLLRPVDLGAIAGSGHTQIPVAVRPRIAILPTGSELRPVGEHVIAGEIIEYNSIMLAAQVLTWGGQPTRYEITPDNLVDIQAALLDAAEAHDMILLNAGSSAGSEDFSSTAIGSLGEMCFHGVAVRPGHPVIFGYINGKSGKKVPVFGVPGYPVSAVLTGEIFIEPILRQWTGQPPPVPPSLEAEITRKLASPGGDDDYVRVVVGKVGVRTLAAPLTRGAGVISSLVRADGIVVLPKGSQGVLAGEKVNIRLYRSANEIDQTIFIIGSHDMTIDLLAQHIARRDRRISSANVGSQAGLVALRRGETHLAGSHLLDPTNGLYNTSYIKQYLPDIQVIRLGFVEREQGLLVALGNPKKIQSLEDLSRSDVRYVNRQRGAGTRVLLDYHLEKLGIENNQIQGYEHEEYTHLAVAAAIASGRADCGLGITAAAKALDLDFIPLFDESYELVIPTQYFESILLAPLLSTIENQQFQADIMKLPGYTIPRIGKILETVGS